MSLVFSTHSMQEGGSLEVESVEDESRPAGFETSVKPDKEEERFTSADVSSDGNTVVTGSNNGMVRVLERGTEKQLLEFKVGDGSLWVTGLSPDEKVILTVFLDGNAQVWDAETGKLIKAFDVEVKDGTFSSDSKFVLTSSYDKTARIWDSKTGEEVLNVPGPSYISLVSFSPDGAYIVAASGSSIYLWDAATGEPKNTFITSLPSLYSVAFNQEGTLLFAGGFDKGELWDVETGTRLRKLQAEYDMTRILPVSQGINTAAFSPDSKFVLTGSRDGAVIRWEVETGKMLQLEKEGVKSAKLLITRTGTAAMISKRGKSVKVLKVAFTPEGAPIAVSENGTIDVWNDKTK